MTTPEVTYSEVLEGEAYDRKRKTTEDHQKEDGNCAQHHSSITLLHGRPQPLLVSAEYINGYCYVILILITTTLMLMVQYDEAVVQDVRSKWLTSCSLQFMKFERKTRLMSTNRLCLSINLASTDFHLPRIFICCGRLQYHGCFNA